MVAAGVGLAAGVIVFLIVLVIRLAERVSRLEGAFEQLVKRVNGRP